METTSNETRALTNVADRLRQESADMIREINARTEQWATENDRRKLAFGYL